MTKVIEQKKNDAIIINYEKNGEIIIENDYDDSRILIEKGKAREVALAIYDWEQERIDFAVGFAKYYEENRDTVFEDEDGEEVDWTVEDFMNDYQQTLLTNGK